MFLVFLPQQVLFVDGTVPLHAVLISTDLCQVYADSRNEKCIRIIVFLLVSQDYLSLYKVVIEHFGVAIGC